METFELVDFRSPRRTGKMRGRWFLAALLALAVAAPVACGTAASAPTTVAEACWEAIAGGDTETAVDLFMDHALVTVDQAVFDGKDKIRDWIDSDIAFLAKGAQCSEWTDVEESASSLSFYARCTMEGIPWEGHHTLYCENGKIKSWTMTFKQSP